MSFDPGSRYITAALIEDGFQVTADDIAYQCRVSQQAYANDTAWFGGGAGVSFFASLAAYGAVGSLTAAVAIPALALVGCSIAAWQVSERADHRETEARLFRKYPQLAQQITKAIESGANTDDLSRGVSNAIATASRDGSRSMPALSMDAKASESWDGDNDAFNDPIVPEIVAAEEEIESSGAEELPRTESAALAQTEILPIASASPSMQSEQNSIAVAPTFGMAKKRNPVDILVSALFAHRAFYGGQRTGKTLLASRASQGIIDKVPGTKVFYINLFAFDREETLSMFAHAHKTVIADLAPLSPEKAVKHVEDLIDVLDEFSQTTGAILILDEAASMGDKFSKHFETLEVVTNELVGYLSSIRDSSKKRRKAVWTIAPGIVARNLSDGMKTLLKGFPPVLVAIPKHKAVDWEGQELTTDNTIAAQLKLNYSGANFEAPAMDCDRAVQIDGVWMPMPEFKRFQSPSTQTTTFQTTAVQDDPAPDDFSDLPDMFRAVALMAMAQNITASDKSFIVNDLNKANEIKASDPLAARERLSKYVA